ncbi:MAG: acyclic terpene utilization AtuA family protein [bacterium]|nr:acyclic terpene utilization AtuA family protein [bacterium]
MARFDTMQITQQDTDRGLVTGVKGEPPTDTLKVCINTMGGFKNTMTVILTGLDIEKKAGIGEETLLESLGGRDRFAVTDVQLVRSDKENPGTNEEAFAYLRITVMDSDQNLAGRVFSAKVVELALAAIPGFTLTGPPSSASPAIVHWPALISSQHVSQTVSVNDRKIVIDPLGPESAQIPEPLAVQIPDVPGGKMVEAPLGRAFATRAGDKGGNANLGVWAKTPEAFAFLREFLTTDRLKELLQDMKPFEIERYELPNLLAINFYIKGVLGEGAAASLRSDPQAKTLGEYLRAKVISIPEGLL